MGITSPYPRENIIAGNYILADTQAFLSKRHRQQNNKILIRHSPGIGGCFLFSGIQLTEKNKKVFLRGLEKCLSAFRINERVFFAGKIKNFHQEAVFMPFIFCISVRTFF